MAKRKATRSPRGKKPININFERGDASDSSEAAQEGAEAPKPQKSKEDIEKERQHEEARHKAQEQYKYDLKHPDERHKKDLHILEEYTKKKAKGGEILMSEDDHKKLCHQIWSPTSLFDMLKEIGWEHFYDAKRNYIGILFRQAKKGKRA
jgi:hypothetical protein